MKLKMVISIMVLVFSLNYAEDIKLEFDNQDTIEIDRELAERSETIKTMLEDSVGGNSIPIIRITLKQFVTFMPLLKVANDESRINKLLSELPIEKAGELLETSDFLGLPKVTEALKNKLQETLLFESSGRQKALEDSNYIKSFRDLSWFNNEVDAKLSHYPDLENDLNFLFEQEFKEKDWKYVSLSPSITSDGGFVAVNNLIYHKTGNDYELMQTLSDVGTDSETKIAADGNYTVTRAAMDIRVFHKVQNKFRFLQQLNRKKQAVIRMAITAEGNTIILQLSNQTILIYQKVNNEYVLLQELTGFSQTSSIALSSEGDYIVIGSNIARIYHKVNDRFELFQQVPQESVLISVAISAHGEYVVTGGSDKTVRIYQKQGNKYSLFQVLINDETVNGVAITPDGSYVVIGFLNETIKLYNKAKDNYELVKRLMTNYLHPSEMLWAGTIGLTSDGSYVICDITRGTTSQVNGWQIIDFNEIKQAITLEDAILLKSVIAKKNLQEKLDLRDNKYAHVREWYENAPKVLKEGLKKYLVL